MRVGRHILKVVFNILAGLLNQAGASFQIENRFGETAASIMVTGNAGKRMNIFSKQQMPSIAELEKMEAEHRSSITPQQALLKQVKLFKAIRHIIVFINITIYIYAHYPWVKTRNTMYSCHI